MCFSGAQAFDYLNKKNNKFMLKVYFMDWVFEFE